MFSDIETEKLYISWRAWKDIKSQEFREGFKELWNLTIEEVECLFKKCNYPFRLREVRKVGLTLQPNISFEFSPLKNAYFLNVWSLFFCPDPKEGSLYFRQPFELAHMMQHEHAHYEFLRNHKMLNKNKDEKIRFHTQNKVEGEKYAHSQEAKFLKKLATVLPLKVDIKWFFVNSWESNGQPKYQIKTTQMWAKKTVKSCLEDVRKRKNKLQNLTALKMYNNEVCKHNTKTHSFYVKILKLDIQSNQFPIVEIEC